MLSKLLPLLGFPTCDLLSTSVLLAVIPIEHDEVSCGSFEFANAFLLYKAHDFLFLCPCWSQNSRTPLFVITYTSEVTRIYSRKGLNTAQPAQQTYHEKNGRIQKPPQCFWNQVLQLSGPGREAFQPPPYIQRCHHSLDRLHRCDLRNHRI